MSCVEARALMSPGRRRPRVLAARPRPGRQGRRWGPGAGLIPAPAPFGPALVPALDRGLGTIAH